MDTPEFSKVIIDGDALLYRSGFATEGEPLAHSLHTLKKQILSIKEDTSENAEIYIKGKGNFRDSVAVSTVYKGTRSGRMPSMYNELREYIIEKHGAQTVDGMEADDMCSYLLFQAFKKGEPVIVASIDKDLWNTPGWHYNYHPEKRTIEHVSLWRANRNFMKQMLTGDPSDNVPGIPGIGEKTAEKILTEAGKDQGDMWFAVTQAYIDWAIRGGFSVEEAESYLIEQGQLLWMTRELDPECILPTPVLWKLPVL